MRLIFDSHLDLAWNALSWKRDLSLPLTELNATDQVDDHPSRGRATISLPELRRAGTAVCLATMMARVPYGSSVTVQGSSLDFPNHANAYGFAHSQLAYYRVLAQTDEVRILTNALALQKHWAEWESSPDWQSMPIGIIPAMEGCDAICHPQQAAEWFDAGLRCASLVHYGSSKYEAGTGDDGPVTPDGVALLSEFERLGMILDTTHLCDRSFFQALDHFAGPILASHQNCRSVVPGIRQFSDDQIRLLLERSGILGIAFDAWMLYPGWERGVTDRAVVSMESAADHVDYICQLAGNHQQVALGTDLDGGYGTEQTPVGLDCYADLQNLADIFAKRGYSAAAIDAIFGKNWLSFFEQHLPQN